jgi:hypothetical protein
LVKKQKREAARQPAAHKTSFDLESTRWFTPAAFVVLFIAQVFLFSKFIFSGQMLYMSDQIQAGVFFRSFFVHYFEAHGSVPQWDPYIFGGMPFVAAFHGDIFYPLSFLKFFDSIYRMLGWNLFWHIFASGIFMYLCARQFKLSKVASLMAGVSYMFSAYLVSLVEPGHDGKIFVTTLFPLTIMFLDRGFETKPLLNFSLLGLVIGIIILSPHAQMAYFTLLALALFTLYKLFVLFREKKSVTPLIKPASLALYAVLIGLLISAIQFYPGYYYTTHFSPRADTKRGWEWATSWSMHEEEAASLLIPEFSGQNTQEGDTYYWGKNPFKDNSESVGVTAIFVALIGVFFSKRRGRYFFAGLALFALFFALGATTPLFRLFYLVIPMVSVLRAPSVIMFLFLFSISLLAAMGLQHILDTRREQTAGRARKFDYLLLGFPAVLLLLALLFSAAGRGMLSAWCSIFYSDAPRLLVQRGITKLDVAYMNLPAIQTGAWMSFLFTGLAALFIWMYRTGKAGTGVMLALVLLPAVNGIRFDKRFIGTYDAARAFAPTPVSQFLTNAPGEFRVLDATSPQGPQSDVLPNDGIEVPGGYHGNQLRWYDDLYGGPGRTNQYNPRLLDLVGTRYLVARTGASLPFPEGALGPIPLVQAANFGQVQIYRNDNALPRVFLADSFRVIPDRKDIYPLVLRGTDDLRRMTYLEEDPGVPQYAGEPSGDSTWIIDHAVDSVLVGLHCSSPHLLVLTDTWYDAWHVTVDGNPAKLLRSYGAFRAVAVPAGSKEVRFLYRSQRYVTGRTITWLTSLYLLVIIGLHLAQRIRKSSKGKPTKS